MNETVILTDAAIERYIWQDDDFDIEEPAPEKSVREIGRKQDRRQIMLALIAAQRQNRTQVAKRMESALDGWFGGLADRVVHRALDQAGKSVKVIAEPPELLTPGDDDELEGLIKRFYLELLQLSWGTWNLELGVDIAFDLQDPAVVKALEGAGAHVKQINETTRQAIQDTLQNGASRGWSIDHIVRGDSAEGIPGLRDIVEQTYKNRAKTIARSELCIAQNQAAGQRYASANVPNALVLDNGVDDSAPGCIVLGNNGKGTIVPLSWAQAHPSGHPNCLRCIAASFEDDGPVNTDLLSQWQNAGGDQP